MVNERRARSVTFEQDGLLNGKSMKAQYQDRTHRWAPSESMYLFSLVSCRVLVGAWPLLALAISFLLVLAASSASSMLYIVEVPSSR